ncbi:ABC transporter substrate-binding protein [Actinacidiphila alni]|uniref:ABC transporter substrate-binding protein n=1 Tax=Actinacidiphila alni TaxID=380248 RepID=UPI003457222C
MTAAGLALGLAVAGCSDSSSGGSGSAGRFTYWSFWKQGEPQQKVLQNAIDSFTKDTGITVDVVWAGRDVVKKQIPAALHTNRFPDLFDQAADQIKPVLADQGATRDLSEVYRAPVTGEPGTTVQDIVPRKYVDSGGLKDKDGHPFLVPYTVTGDGLFYDPGALPAVAADPPKTWDDFTATLARIKVSGGMAPLTNDADQTWSNVYWMDYLLTRSQGPGTVKRLGSDRSGKAWKSADVLRQAQRVQNLVKAGDFLSGYDATAYPAQQKQWANGKAGFFLLSSWLPVEVAAYAKPGFTVASVPFPSVDGKPVRSEEVALDGFAITAKSKHAAEAEKFIAYFMNKSRLTAMATQAQSLSVRADIPAPPALAGIKASLDSVATITPFGDGTSELGTWGDKVYYPIFGDLFTGKIDARQFCDKMASAQAGYWKAQG